jgi:hypothetical protein
MILFCKGLKLKPDIISNVNFTMEYFKINKLTILIKHLYYYKKDIVKVVKIKNWKSIWEGRVMSYF